MQKAGTQLFVYTLNEHMAVQTLSNVTTNQLQQICTYTYIYIVGKFLRGRELRCDSIWSRSSYDFIDQYYCECSKKKYDLYGVCVCRRFDRTKRSPLPGPTSSDEKPSTTPPSFVSRPISGTRPPSFCPWRSKFPRPAVSISPENSSILASSNRAVSGSLYFFQREKNLHSFCVVKT